MKLGILGAGFGLALAVMWEKYGHEVIVYSSSAAEIAVIKADGENRLKLPGVIIPGGVKLTSTIGDLSESEIIISSVPTFAIRSVLNDIKPVLSPGATIVNSSKGFEDGSLFRMSEVMADVCPSNPCVILSGPSHAEEVGRGVPTAVTSASTDEKACVFIEETLSNEVFRIYRSDDVIGCELGGALKNIIALACGICDGLSEKYPIGDNTKAALMTRGLSEITRLGIAMGAKKHTFAGLSGLGDLIVTCTSMHSRNRRAGILIGKGINPQAAVDQIGTVEGYFCTKSAFALSKKYGVSMPITEQVFEILFNSKSPIAALTDLMERPPKDEDINI
ncbi:MAG: NAD(P)-dependent glycerol-3-phosphate dehydrogenase [Ruminococcus sp.]|jgi:glycerol-3-phosphate dehydrogenase (NAD(P)+)|nr:NAD(P)-dependent glycerol-3-phosphate dehydrogenase [Ruminococcus sp.]